MKEAFKFLEQNTQRPMISDVFEEDELIETVTVSDAQWACKKAVVEELYKIIDMIDMGLHLDFIKAETLSRIKFLNNKNIKLSQHE